MLSTGIYFSLFVIAFLAATILPLQSEAVLTGLLVLNHELWWLLIAVASLGNTLGAVVNWGMGLGLQRFQNQRWFPATPQQLQRATATYQRFGRWCLLLSWLPIVGDALTVVAGVLHEKLWVFVALVGIGKTGRYLVLAAAVAKLW
jgi:membrane protein YqaA with SNARE-associated domain